MAEKPRLLVIDRDSSHGKTVARPPGRLVRGGDRRGRSRKALSLLREQKFAGVYVDASQLSAVRWVGMMIQAEEILDAIADGVAVVDPDLRIIWANPEFHSLTDPTIAAGRRAVLPGAGQAGDPRARPLPVHLGGGLARRRRARR